MLQLFTTHAKNLPAGYTLDAKLVGQPWTNGTGFESAGDCNNRWRSMGNSVCKSWSYQQYGTSTNTLSGSSWISSSQAN